MSRFYSLGRVGERDIERDVRVGALPPIALEIERHRALIEATTFGPVLLEFVAYGNEDPVYGEVCQAEIARREAMCVDE